MGKEKCGPVFSSLVLDTGPVHDGGMRGGSVAPQMAGVISEHQRALFSRHLVNCYKVSRDFAPAPTLLPLTPASTHGGDISATEDEMDKMTAPTDR